MNAIHQDSSIRELDRKIASFESLRKIAIPREGWIYAIRTALKMSLRQLGNKLKITAQGVKSIETREKEGTITLKNLKEVAEALDMKLVYGFIPKDESLEKMIEKRAYEMAVQIVTKASHTMKLEAQETSETHQQQAIQEKASQIRMEMPRYLWD